MVGRIMNQLLELAGFASLCVAAFLFWVPLGWAFLGVGLILGANRAGPPPPAG